MELLNFLVKYLFKKTKLKRRLFFLLADTLLIATSLSLAFWLRFEARIPSDYFPGFYYFLAIALIIKIFVLALFGVYNFSWGLFGLKEAIRLMGAIFVSYAIYSPVVFLLRNRFPFYGFPRGVLLADFVLTTAFLGGLRISKRAVHEILLKRSLLNSHRRFRTLIIGAGEAGLQISKEMLNNPKSEYLPVAFIDDDPAKRNLVINGIKVLGGRKSIPEAIKKLMVERILIAIPSAGSSQIREIVQIIRQTNKNIEIKILPGLLSLPEGNVSLSQVDSIQPEDLLGREKINIDYKIIEKLISGKKILVTGAGGSIGSEVVKTCLKFGPELLLALDIDETELFMLNNCMKSNITECKSVVADIRDRIKISNVFSEYRPDIVIHAAAYKHVPMMEEFPDEAIKTNVYGTRILAEEAIKNGVRKFINISTDKAVNPTSIMGASKRVAEEMLKSLNQLSQTKFVSVRFGNVVGSRGSVIPLFKEQIKRGGPVTVTHPEMRRYFMDTSEAVMLVLQAAAAGEGGEVFILDMGEPIKIVDLAREMIRLSGYEPDVDIPIVFTGVRPGEKLFEELLGAEEGSEPTEHPKIYKARNSRDKSLTIDKQKADDELMSKIDKLIALSMNSAGREEIIGLMKEIVPTYSPTMK